MRTLCKLSFCLAVAALVVSPALAQRPRQPGGTRGGFGGRGNLATNKSVQDELKLSDEQKKELETLNAKVQEATRAIIAAETKKLLSGVLKGDQLKRYEQITRQQQGVRAFTSSDVQSALKLTDQQKKKITDAVADYTKKSTELFRPGGGGRPDFTKIREDRERLTKETMATIAKELTPAQKSTWQKLVGTPFEVKFDAGRRPGGTRPGGTRPGGNRPARPAAPPARVDLR
jgi:hypothetical protein